jgi:hypothetical protein
MTKGEEEEDDDDDRERNPAPCYRHPEKSLAP